MQVIWQSVKFKEPDIVDSYVRRYSDGTVKIFDVNNKKKTIREYWKNDKGYEGYPIGEIIKI